MLPNLQKLANVPEVPVAHLYRDIINTSEPTPIHTIKDDNKNPSLIWTILMCPGTYTGTIGMIFLYVWVSVALKDCGSGLPSLGTDLIPQSLGDMPEVDDEVKVAPIYRCGGMVQEPRSHPKNHDQHIEWQAAQPKSHCK